MTKMSFTDVIKQCIDLLNALEDNQRDRAVASILAAIGMDAKLPNNDTSRNNQGNDAQSTTTTEAGKKLTPTGFFKAKEPKNKGERLAVAARYRELHEQAEQHNKDDLKKIHQLARQNFDAHNFPADIKNAQTNSCYFNTGGAKGEYQLSFYGQEYVDKMPDREAMRALKKPRKKSSRKKAVKKSSRKKASKKASSRSRGN